MGTDKEQHMCMLDKELRKGQTGRERSETVTAMVRLRRKIVVEECKKNAWRMEAEPLIWEYHQRVQEKTGLLHDRVLDILQVALAEEWTAQRFIMSQEREFMEYCDRRGQYGWDTLNYGDLVIRHAQYYEMDEEESEDPKTEMRNGQFQPKAMGSKHRPGAFRTDMDIYLDKHGEKHGIMAPCGCMLTQPGMAQGSEMGREPTTTTKEEAGLGSRGRAPMGRGQNPRRGGWSR